MNIEFEKTYDSCIIRGQIIENTQETANIKNSIQDEIMRANKLLDELKTQKTKTPEQKTKQFNTYYDALEMLKNILLQKNNVKIGEKQCKNAYICIKYPSLELNYEFLENTRLKKELQKEIKNEEWSMMKINFELHIRTLLNKLHTNN